MLVMMILLMVMVFTTTGTMQQIPRLQDRVCSSSSRYFHPLVYDDSDDSDNVYGGDGFFVESKAKADDDNSFYCDADDNDGDLATDTSRTKPSVFVKYSLFSSISLHSYATHPKDLRLQQARLQSSCELDVFCL